MKEIREFKVNYPEPNIFGRSEFNCELNFLECIGWEKEQLEKIRKLEIGEVFETPWAKKFRIERIS